MFFFSNKYPFDSYVLRRYWSAGSHRGRERGDQQWSRDGTHRFAGPDILDKCNTNIKGQKINDFDFVVVVVVDGLVSVDLGLRARATFACVVCPYECVVWLLLELRVTCFYLYLLFYFGLFIIMTIWNRRKPSALLPIFSVALFMFMDCRGILYCMQCSCTVHKWSGPDHLWSPRTSVSISESVLLKRNRFVSTSIYVLCRSPSALGHQPIVYGRNVVLYGHYWGCQL